MQEIYACSSRTKTSEQPFLKMGKTKLFFTINSTTVGRSVTSLACVGFLLLNGGVIHEPDVIRDFKIKQWATLTPCLKIVKVQMEIVPIS